MADWTSREYLGLITILKEEFEEVGDETCSLLRILEFHLGISPKISPFYL